MPAQNLAGLLEKYASGQLTADEELAFHQQIAGTDRQTKEDLLEQYQQIVMRTSTAEPDKALFQRIKEAIVVMEKKENSRGQLISFGSWKKIAVAASVLLVISLTSYLIITRSSKNKIVNIDSQDDVKAPSGTKAVLTLTNGKKIFLDSINSGTLAVQGSVNIEKTADGGVVYTGGSSAAIAYNSVFNPRGSMIVPLTLNDGTKVWLNSESSIRFPTAFTGKERKVTITGEAYFEVTHDPSKPFIVSKGETNITVLGTHFNVNAYDDEPNLKVTLLEGSVMVNNTKIKPGQQAIVGEGINVSDNTDMNAVMAWKNGKFSFKRSDIKTVMRELARWYDLEVEFSGPPTTDLFGGDMQRSLPLLKVLEFLKKSQVNFNVNGNKVIVSP